MDLSKLESVWMKTRDRKWLEDVGQQVERDAHEVMSALIDWAGHDYHEFMAYARTHVEGKPRG